MRKTTQLRRLLRKDGILIAAGVFDAVSAKLAEKAGFKVAIITGLGVAATIGFPDTGLVSMSEVVEEAGRISAAVDIPVICDADTGYGNAMNVVRTVRELERAGVAGVHLEDQITPKKCGLMANKELISREEMSGKIRAAVENKEDNDFVIIGRTDAVHLHGIDEAIQRANAYSNAGADLIMTAEGVTVGELKKLCKGIRARIVVVPPPPPKTYPPPDALARIGCKVVMYAVEPLFWAAQAMWTYYTGLMTRRIEPRGRSMTFDAFNEMIGLSKINQISAKYAT